MNGYNYGPYQDYSGFYGIAPDGQAVLEEMFSGMMGVVLGVILVMYLLLLALCVVIYIFQSVSFYTIAKRRQIRNPWLAWVPLGNTWILGSISDQYRYVAKGQVTNRRRILLILNILPLPLGFALGFLTGFLAEDLTVIMAALMVLYLVLMVLAVVSAVFFYMALYDVFASCSPNNAVLALVFSVLFSVTQPFFLFAYRKQDGGMPPRRQEPQLPEDTGAEPVPEAVPAPVEEPAPAEEPTPEENN